MEEMKRCPFCGEEILANAQKCKHCGEWLDDNIKKNNNKNNTKDTVIIAIVIIFVSIVSIIAITDKLGELHKAIEVYNLNYK